ncbi:MAG: lipopolysaccharide heptosyltransferase II [bacterium]|nr:lipopolysaccharide heptosyltransferase II [bacterium]
MSSWGAASGFARILVRCPNWLGDAVMATPGLHALRAHYPEAKIVGQLPDVLMPLLEGAGLFDELWPLDSRGGGFAGWRSDIARIAEARFDLGVVIPESISSALLMRLGRVGRVTGFARDPLRRALLHRVIVAPEAWGRRRMVSRERFVMTLMEALGIEEEACRLTLSVSPDEELRLAGALEKAGTRLSDLVRNPPVVIAPGASFGAAKCWPADSYAALADRLGGRGLPIVLLAAPGEHERVAAVSRAMRSEAIMLDGVLDLGALKALLRLARALVANDAGARHVAAAFGVPSVIFFGPTSVAKTADHLSLIEVLETDSDCRPCYRRHCPIDHRCLRSIDVDAAEAASVRALARAASSRDLGDSPRRAEPAGFAR